MPNRTQRSTTRRTSKLLSVISLAALSITFLFTLDISDNQEEQPTNRSLQSYFQYMWDHGSLTTGVPDPSKEKILKSPFFHPSQSDFEYCAKHNVILQPKETWDHYNKNKNRVEPFSLLPAAFAPNHAKICETSQEILEAIQNGRRHWEEEEDGIDMSDEKEAWIKRENLPSYFVPSKCDLPAYSPPEACSIINQFSRIIIEGDSMQRHMRGGFLLSLSNDLVSGMITADTSDPRVHKACRCDGQFSEAPLCRNLGPHFYDASPQDLGVCSSSSTSRHRLEDKPIVEVMTTYQHNKNYKLEPYSLSSLFPGPKVNCSDENMKPILIVSNGGMWYSTNPTSTYNIKLDHLWFRSPEIQECARQNKIIFIWSGYEGQSPRRDEQWPHQSFGNATIFNDKIQHFLQRDGAGDGGGGGGVVVTINWQNFTKADMTSDGGHKLMSTNYFKAQYVMRLADRLLEEGRFFKVPEKFLNEEA